MMNFYFGVNYNDHANDATDSLRLWFGIRLHKITTKTEIATFCYAACETCEVFFCV